MTTILVIEDNPITRKLVRYTLESARYTVVDAPDGMTGLDEFRARRPTLVLLDLLLPDIDGFELFHRLRALPDSAGIPILAFSGMLSSYDESRISEVGFDDVVSKPIEPSRLLRIVKGYIAPVDLPAVPAVAAGEPVKTLVVADDDAVQRKIVALRLQRAGFKVVTAADGDEAVAHARAIKPYAIVSDVLMPRLDGFGLCMAVRNDAEIADTPVVLISNSYLDAEDKALARRVGADDLLVRTPELRDLIALLHAPGLGARHVRVALPVTIDPDVERERVGRMMNQLERQAALHVGLNQRCSLLSAELSVLSGISEAVATEDDLEGALHQILATCFDAGGISLGLLYLQVGDGRRGVRFGPVESWTGDDIDSFFGHREILDTAIESQQLTCLPSDACPEAECQALLDRIGARSLMIAPLGHKGQQLGALVTMSRSLAHQPSDGIAFAQAVAGQISLALALARSFQAKDASEQAARASESVLRSILDSMAEGVIVSDAHGAITHWNQAAITILQQSPSELPRAVLERPEFPLARALHGEAVDRAEIMHDGARGHRWLSVNARPLGDDDHGIRGGLAVFRDVTIEKEANQRLLVSERLASLGTLAAGVGHEINNPLMAVIGNLEMAVKDLERISREGSDPGQLAEVMDQLGDAREAAERVRNIVRDLKLFSRSDEETRAPLQIEKVLESSIRMVWNEVRHRATLVREFAKVAPVYGNESRLGQIFLNLIVNAAQAIPEGHADQEEIRVATSMTADGRVRIDVRDSGSGMTPEVASKIFTPFFTTKPIGVGTGLGLSICHQLVTALGGEITLDTELGVGTTFTVTLPAAVELVDGPGPDVPATQAASRRGQVLLVEDELIVITTIRRALKKDHDVIGLTDPREAARLIASGTTFDMILCDLMMPNVTGMDLYAQIATIAPGQAARMVFITGGAFTPQAQAFVDSDEHTCIEKPIDLRALRELVNTRVQLARAPGGARP